MFGIAVQIIEVMVLNYKNPKLNIDVYHMHNDEL